jgi:hypothetical protein
MHARHVAFTVLLVLLFAADHRLSISVESSSDAAPVGQLRTLPLLFEETPDGPSARARGLTAIIEENGVALAAGGGTVRLEFLGTGGGAVRAESPLAARIHRLRGPRAAWRTDIPTFGRVRLAGIYPGIDAIFYGRDRELEYDLEVGAGADPGQIAVAFRGAAMPRVDEQGQLLIALGDRTIVQRAPIAYQERDGAREAVAVSYALSGYDVRFVLGPYDRSRPLVIDPIISYSTYFGVEGHDYITDVEVDGAGNVLIAGGAGAGTFPEPSIRQRPVPASADGDSDPFIAKLSPDGTPLWLTFLGGSGWDAANDVAAGPGGDVFVAGVTASTDFPASPGAYDTTANLVNGLNIGDAFVARLSPDGSDLRYATYLGGTESDTLNVLKVDASGRAHVGGTTNSPNFPATIGGPSRATADSSDAYVARLSADGAALEMARLIAGDKADAVHDLALDSVGEIDVAGGTTSSIFPVVNAMRATKFEPGDAEGETGWDGFVMRLTTGGEIRFSTYLGGMGEDYLAAIGRSPNGASIYLAGSTTSDGFPGTTSSRPNRGSDPPDIFVVRMEDNGMRMMGGRYHGGSAADIATGLAVDRFGLVWVTGYTSSSGFPSAGPFPPTPRGSFDIVAAQFSPDLWDTYFSAAFGGSDTDIGNGLALDGRGNVWIAGNTSSTNYPVVSPIQPAKKGTQPVQADGVLTAVACEVTNAGYTPHRTVGAAGSTGTITIAMDPGCQLTPTTTVDWLRVTEIGPDRLHYRVDPNPGAISRTGWIMVEPDWGHRVTQLGTASPQHGSATEIVLGPEDATAVRGSWVFDTDPSDEHFILRQPDRGRPKATRPEIVPEHFFELEFFAEAGRPYRLWVLGAAQPRHWANDSVHVQFSDSIDTAGNAVYRIGTRSSAEVNLEDCSGCGVPSGYSWEDNGWGSAGALGPPIRFASTGWHRLWVQTREDGMAIGQIVLSAERYFSAPPPEGEWVDAPGHGDEDEIVLHARGAAEVAGAWRFAADATASRGERLWHPDAGAAKVTTPSASPQHYVEFTFAAVAGRPYKLWLRLKAERNYWANDSVWVQFSDSVNASGEPIARIGSSAGLDVNLEECSGCGIDGWGWRDEGWGASPPPRGVAVYFAASGTHTLRVQTREDGVSFDQIVISADAYLHAPPGPAKRDDTIFE